MKPTDIGAPDYFHKVVDCQWACPAHTPVPEYIRLIAAGRYDDAYMVNWESNVFPGILGTHLRPPVRTGLPPQPRRGCAGRAGEGVRRQRGQGTGRDLPPEAGRRRQQGRHPRAPAGGAEEEKRQAHRLRRRRPGVAHRGARPGAAWLSCRRVRRGRQGGRHDPQPDSQVSPARGSDRRGSRLHPRPRHRVSRRQARGQHEGPAGGGL